ncbi:hypothetical protein [Streptomyces sp. NPDC057428]|uniref:hypothetical protein n=1 Tax=Streptomyces sp. NPDC057428 TaxID=3346129 RepID=UPI0036A32C86
MRSPGRATVLWCVVAALAAAVCWWVAPDGGTVAGPDRVTAGRECHSELPPGAELSCGTYGFGDLRYVCSAGFDDEDRCVRTSQVTVRNAGRSTVYVACIVGPHQGVREEGPRQALEPGGEATLRPGGGRLFFDITLRGTDGGPNRLEVLRVG